LGGSGPSFSVATTSTAAGTGVNAVREYYSALESGLKYALHEGDVTTARRTR
jgi:hypothetical protein